MKINLLPQESRSLPIVTTRTLVVLLVAVLLLGGAGYAYWRIHLEVLDKQEALASLQATHETLRPITDKVKALEDGRKRLQEAQAARSFLVQPVMLSDLLIELSQIIPQDVTLREVSLTDTGNIQIRAQGQALTSAARMLIQLGKSKYLSDAKVGSIRSDGATGFSFDVTCRVGKGVAKP